MFTCPQCKKGLATQRTKQGVFWLCSSCGGRAASLGVLRKTLGTACVARLWDDAPVAVQEDRCACPVCSRAMEHMAWKEREFTLPLNLCRRCAFVWFAPHEYEAIASLPVLPPVPGAAGAGTTELPLAAREAIAMEKVRELASDGYQLIGPPDEMWKNVPGLFGFPVEMQSVPDPQTPRATYGLSALIAVVSVWAFLAYGNPAPELGLLPDDLWRYGGLTFVTSFFVHAGIMHLVGNLYFLVLFGRHVEDYIGSVRWLILVAVAAVVGDFVHIIGNVHSSLPLIGASGGISGVIAFYALEFPHAKLGILFRYFVLLRWITMPAWVAFLLWVGLQILGSYSQVEGTSDVASLAHLGGVGAGFVFWVVWRKIGSKPPAAPIYPHIQIRS